VLSASLRLTPARLVLRCCRQQLGIKMVGDPAIQHLINVHFYSEQLAQLLAARPAMLHFVFSSQAIVVMVTHSMARGEFVAQGGRGGWRGRGGGWYQCGCAVLGWARARRSC
jgi:hypothetical protein